jgi:hypothetical protein
VRDIDFKVIFDIEIQINSQKTRFWKEKSVDVVTLGPTTQAKLMLIIQQGIETHKNCWTM